MIPIDSIICADNVETLKQFPDDCIDLTVTSPPYDNLRDYKNYAFDFESIAKQLYRVTKVGGIVVWVVGDATINGSETGTSFRQALYFMKIGFRLHDTMIYMRPSRFVASNRYSQCFEYMFVFSVGKSRTFNPIKRKNITAMRRALSGVRNRSGELIPGKYHTRHKESNQFNIWLIAAGSGSSTKDLCAFEHPAIFPEQLAHDHILSWSNEGDLVLDPFNGSGTTTKQAALLNRKYIGIDCSEEYCKIARKRLSADVDHIELVDGLSINDFDGLLADL